MTTINNPRYLPPRRMQRKTDEKQSTTWAFSFVCAAINEPVASDKNRI